MALFSRQAIFGLLEETTTRSSMGVMRRDALAHGWWYTSPSALVIHEVFGLNENIKDITRRFADQGYAALAVDLFFKQSRVMCMFRLFAGMQFNSLEHQGIQDLKAALTHLASQPGVDANRLGAVGYCLGGGLAIALACADNRLRAIAPYYGMNPRPLEAVKRSCPVVGSYPGSVCWRSLKNTSSERSV